MWGYLHVCVLLVYFSFNFNVFFLQIFVWFWCRVIRHRESVFPLEVYLWFIYMSHLLLVFLCAEESHLTLDILVS